MQLVSLYYYKFKTTSKCYKVRNRNNEITTIVQINSIITIFKELFILDNNKSKIFTLFTSCSKINERVSAYRSPNTWL